MRLPMLPSDTLTFEVKMTLLQQISLNSKVHGGTTHTYSIHPERIDSSFKLGR